MLRFVLLSLFCLAAAAQAAPERYRLDAARSEVAFSYGSGDAVATGRMPVKSADLLIDLDSLPASRVAVTLDVRAARAGFFLATQAMKSAEVLDTARFPEITFRSTRISGSLSGATITGNLTIRDVTRQVTLRAGLYRQRGTDPDDFDHLTILITGSVSRKAFGAGGYPDLAGDRIGLKIIARIEK